MNIVCEKVGLEYFENAATLYKATEIVTATPDQIFEVFLDADAWVEFAMPIEKVEWTSPFPLEVGSTRSVHMMGDIVGHEEFIAWEHGKRMAFRFNEVSGADMPAFGEDYIVTDLGDGTCKVEWIMAMGAPGGERTPPDEGMQSFVELTLRTFRELTEARYAKVA